MKKIVKGQVIGTLHLEEGAPLPEILDACLECKGVRCKVTADQRAICTCGAVYRLHRHLFENSFEIRRA